MRRCSGGEEGEAIARWIESAHKFIGPIIPSLPISPLLHLMYPLFPTPYLQAIHLFYTSHPTQHHMHIQFEFRCFSSEKSRVYHNTDPSVSILYSETIEGGISRERRGEGEEEGGEETLLNAFDAEKGIYQVVRTKRTLYVGEFANVR